MSSGHGIKINRTLVGFISYARSNIFSSVSPEEFSAS